MIIEKLRDEVINKLENIWTREEIEKYINQLRNKNEEMLRQLQKETSNIPNRSDERNLEIETQDLLNLYLNYYFRRIPVKKYNVKVSKEIENLVDNDCKSTIANIKNDLEKGKDINARVSRGILKFESNDKMLNRWGLYHLHLGSEMEKDGFIQRTGKLLIIYVNKYKNIVYFLAVAPGHGKSYPDTFIDSEYLKTLVENWKEVREELECESITGIGPEMKDEDMKKILERSNINLCVVKSGNVLITPPGLGIAMDGSSIEVRRLSMLIVKKCKTLEKIYGDKLGIEISQDRVFLLNGNQKICL